MFFVSGFSLTAKHAKFFTQSFANFEFCKLIYKISLRALRLNCTSAIQLET